jgi:anthraniloyl-CoA monooxygenase
MSRTVNILGGGPAGLMSAQLLARDHPDWEVIVHERLEPDDTYGFGVGLTRALLGALEKETPELTEDLVHESAEFSSAAFWLPSGVVELPSFHAGAIGRARMLRLLTEAARAAGVDVRIGSTPTVDDVRAESDLVIGADGMSSPTRERLAGEVGATETIGRGLFIWCGAEIALEGTVFMPVQTEEGTFVAHAYPYAPGLSTFVVETDVESLRRAGCRTDEFTEDGDSDDASLAYLSRVFRDLLSGGRFIGNRSRWMNFRTVRCERWSHENVVLLGDAAATAHPTIGSGTKLALEAAITLAATMRTVNGDSPVDRLSAFEREARPQVEKLQDRARRSQLWWESFPSRMSLSPARIAFAYMSRAGAVSLDQLRQASPSLAGQAVADFAGIPARLVPREGFEDWVLARPLQVNGHALPGRLVGADVEGCNGHFEVGFEDPWGPEAAALIEHIAALSGGPKRIVELTGPDARGALLDRLALGERLRSELGVVVAVRCDRALLADAIDGLVAGRADLVELATS